MKYRQIKFKNRTYYLIGTKKAGGAIATKHQFEHGLQSFAHLYPNGEINRFGNIIGNIKEIKFGNKIELKPNIFMGMMNLLDWGFSL